MWRVRMRQVAIFSCLNRWHGGGAVLPVWRRAYPR